MKRIFSDVPFYPWLLPFFFVLHGYRENFGHIPAGDAAMLFLYYLSAMIVAGLLLFWITKNIRKAALISFTIFCLYFFYGALHDFFKDYSSLSFLARYRFLVPACLVVLTTVIIYCIVAKSKLLRLTFFLNFLFLLYIGIDLAGIVVKSFDSGTQKRLTFGPQLTVNCQDCAKPDIYFLIFDSYSGSASLKRLFNFSNPLDSILVAKGFRIQKESRSNYNLTPFSIASMLNMSYLQNLEQPRQLKPEDYMACNLAIRNNRVTGFLEANGYSIVNYSVFDLAFQPTLAKKSFLPLKTNLITENTLFGHVERDLDWIFVRFPLKYFTVHPWKKLENENQLFLDLATASTREKKAGPRFVYLHVFMPHRPYFFDRNGRRKADSTVVREFHESNVDAVLDYMLYANKKIETLIDSIQKNDPSALILLMGDHGHGFDNKSAFPDHFFANMNAVYYPDRDYKLLYDSISGVNQFRVVLNKWFRQSLPLLKDSSTFVEAAENFKP